MPIGQNSNKAKINYLAFKYFPFLIIAVSCLVFAVGFFYIIKPKYNTVASEVESKLSDYRSQLETRDSYLNKLVDLNQVFEKIDKNDRDKIDGILPGKEDGADLMRQLEKIVRSNGALLSSLNIEKAKAAASPKNPKDKSKPKEAIAASGRAIPEGVGKLDASMDVEGVNYNVLKKLLASFENSIRLIDVEKIDFDPAGMSAKITLSAYYLK
jgi:hypothetical protein